MPEYFDRYINLVDDIELLEAFDRSLAEIDSLDVNALSQHDGLRYAPDKWTVKENLQHVVDWERILSYRALLFARREGSPQAGVDENKLAEGMNANDRSIPEILAELKAVRRSTRALYEGFSPETLTATGICWQYEMSVLALGFTMIGHVKHHLKIVDERYLQTRAAQA